MNSSQIQYWIQHPEALNKETLYELRNLVVRYPYFQSARLLYLKNLYLLHDINFSESTVEYNKLRGLFVHNLLERINNKIKSNDISRALR